VKDCTALKLPEDLADDKWLQMMFDERMISAIPNTVNKK
jgi:hypothetical protein